MDLQHTNCIKVIRDYSKILKLDEYYWSPIQDILLPKLFKTSYSLDHTGIIDLFTEIHIFFLKYNTFGQGCNVEQYYTIKSNREYLKTFIGALVFGLSGCDIKNDVNKSVLE